jgi:hypothetical protein
MVQLVLSLFPKLIHKWRAAQALVLECYVHIHVEAKITIITNFDLFQ